MDGSLLVRVNLHTPRYHGRPEWPPSPGRLFQALVAAAGPRLEEPAVRDAFRWLEELPAPVIGAPAHTMGSRVLFYVPNNDLDALQGDPDRVPELRTGKWVEPRLLASNVPFLFAWSFRGDPVHAHTLAGITSDMYQFGQGTDMAWATAELVESREVCAALDRYPGTIYQPTPGAGERRLPAPVVGSFDSLEQRFVAQGERFRREGINAVFVQPPKPRFGEVSYGSPPARFVFELRTSGGEARLAPIELEQSHVFVVALRDAAVARLIGATGRTEDVHGVLIGRRPGEPETVPRSLRVRMIPLPSIGHAETDPRIRRLMIEVPPGGPLQVADVRWAFSGLEVDGMVLVESPSDAMGARFLRPSSRWQSITPVALPVSRRRLEPTRIRVEAKDAPERECEETTAIDAIVQALRHAGVQARPIAIAVQREPHFRKGARAEACAAPPRFPKEKLWHVDVTFDRPVDGPLVLGDGRYVGLGLFVPVPGNPGVFVWRISSGLEADADPMAVASALRRAVMARAQVAWGRAPLPDYVTGHRADGSPVQGHEHLHYVADLPRSRLLVLDPRGRRDQRLVSALSGLTELRAGAAGLLSVSRMAPDSSDPLQGPASTWRSLTPYRLERHAKRTTAEDAVVRDVREACRRGGLPEPVRVGVTDLHARSGTGLEARVEIEFTIAVTGPLLLGRSRHFGGGVFEVVD